jgi:pimeloyl-ACP methyl ester carboxylesterase
MPILNRNGVALYYEVRGEGPTLLLTHGFMCTSEIWAPQIEALSRHLKLIVWDIRGHGRSMAPDDPSQFSEEASVSDMAALLDGVGAQQAIVGGHSLGGYLSLMFDLSCPERVRALLLVGTGPGFRNDEARAQWNARSMRKAERLEREGLRPGESAACTHRMGAKGLALAARGIVTQRDGRVIENLPNVHVPTQIVLGENDAPFLAAADAMRQKISGARKVVIAGAGHNVNSDQPKLFNDALLEFLADNDLLS